MDPAIVVDKLKKNYGSLTAVDGVSFNVAGGEIFSLLGPNGAGKTTVLNMLACLLEPSDGDTFIMGCSIRTQSFDVRRTIGVVPQDIALYQDLSARENLEFWGKMQGLRGPVLQQRVTEVLEITGLADRQKGAVEKFSGGMKRRLNIGIALVHRPKVIFMDEPTVGIDPQSRRAILDHVKALNHQGMTVLYTTHYMEEAQELSDHIGIMDHGKLIAEGTHNELIKLAGGLDRIELSVNNPSSDLPVQWQSIEGVRRVTEVDEKSILMVEDSNFVLPRLFESASRAGVRITSIAVQEPNLEAVFLQMTGRALRD